MDNFHQKQPQAVILEIRAGAGGKEAAFFADNLYNMYSKYAESQNWKFKLIEQSKDELGGIREISFEIQNPNAYEKLKYEAGVHRVQRIPSTEKSGRIHTSTASVTVLPIYEEKAFEIKQEDLEIAFTHSGGKGGQNVNKVETAVRMTHKPSGLVVRCTNERSQLKNRNRALEILKSKLETLEEEKRAKEEGDERRNQIGTADRSEKIRTYNILQDRVTDHRIKKSWHNIEGILNGEIGPILESFKDS